MTTTFPTPRERSLEALKTLDDLDGLNRAEAFMLGYETAWDNAIHLTEQICETINQHETEETE